MKETIAFQIALLYRSFLVFTTEQLKLLGLSFGQMPFLLYVGKHPGCTQAELTRELKLDWGYSQRSIGKMVKSGFLQKSRSGKGSCNCLTLSESGTNAFETVHGMFRSWDVLAAGGLSSEEKETLLFLLGKIAAERKEGC